MTRERPPKEGRYQQTWTRRSPADVEMLGSAWFTPERRGFVQHHDFDAIVVGAGLAGLCCAGELVKEGRRPLLVCETKEVGLTFRSEWLGNNRGIMQHLVWAVGWGGGWWYPLTRQLNVPVRFRGGPHFAGTILGSGTTFDIPVVTSSAGMLETIDQIFPLPDGPLRSEFGRALQLGLQADYRELFQLHEVPLMEWFRENGVAEEAAMLVMSFAGLMHELSLEESIKHLSVMGGLLPIRALLCGENAVTVIYPDAREGLCIPLAKAIEQRGGEVWRGRKVARVEVDDARVAAVVLEDGTEVRAPQVAIATGNSRIASLLDPLPPEIVEPLAYTDTFQFQDFTIWATLDKPVMPPELEHAYLLALDPMGSMLQVSWGIHAMAPWTTEPNKQFLGSQSYFPATTVEKMGGEEAVYEQMHNVNEGMYPGYKAAIDQVKTGSHKHTWFSPCSAAPKLPRTIESVEDLWFVGDGSVPVGGLWTEAAASAGILGARGMIAARADRRSSG
jgi:phytoene dehydrogenase-like protein